MRHRKKINHLGRKSAHRKSMIANMASSLILHKRIKTTLAKAKALRTYVEPLITRSKEDTTHSRRMVFRILRNKEAVTELFREVSIRIAERPGGYTRIIKLGTRLGDNAEMALIELVDFNENLLGEKDSAKAKSTRRGRRGTKKKTEDTVAAPKVKKTEKAVKEPAKEEAPAETVTETIEEEAPAETVAETIEDEAPAETVAETIEEEAPAETVEETAGQPVAEETTETLTQAEEQEETGETKPEEEESKS